MEKINIMLRSSLKGMVLSAIALLTHSSATAQKSADKEAPNVARVEPSNWWVGMRDPNVQVMLHGKEIANLTPELKSRDVKIVDVTRTDNANYLFVTLQIAEDAAPGSVTMVLKGNGASTKIDYPLLERRAGSAERMGFSSADAVYLLMPDRFANGDPANDNVEGMAEQADRNEGYGRHGGDIQGIINHLDYISGLGMTALWCTPLLENNMPESSYHGYAITDYYAVDRRLGTLDDIRRLSAELHKRGMKHIMDMVFNHCGTGHWWMEDLPCRDWLNRWSSEAGQDTFVRSNYRLSVLRDTHASRSDFALAQQGWFDTSMPDMNLRNPLVRNYLIQNSIWWIETADLDGIRQDTYPYSDVAAMEEWCNRVLAEYPNFNIVGESWISEASKLAIWQRGFGKAHGLQDSGCPSIMDFPLQEALPRAMGEEPGWSQGTARIYDSFANDYLYPDPQSILIFGENHDTGRLLTMLNSDTAALRMTTALLATARGIPQLYYGTELLMEGKGWEGHDQIRRDFPGGWAGDTQNLFESRAGAVAEMHDLTARLFNFRKGSEALQHGTMTHFVPEENVYVFFRIHAASGERVMTILNLAHESRTLRLSRFEEISKNGIRGTDIVSGSKVDAKETLSVAPRTAMVISLKRG